MAGIRIGGTAVISGSSLPYSLTDDDANVNIWRVIGGTPTNLTNFVTADGVLAYSEKFNPMLSPDGTTIAYTVLDGDTLEWDIWTVPGTGGTPVQIRAASVQELHHPFWHPDSSHFLYTEGNSGSVGGDVRRMDADGSNDTEILAAAAGQQLYRPQYNSDGTLIVFARRVSVGPVYTLRVMEDDGTNEVSIRTLVNYAAEGSQYAFANTSNRIAFWDGSSGGTVGESYTIDPDGTDLVQISTPDNTPMRISKYSWLPDDSEILGSAFVDPGPPPSPQYFMVTMDPAGGPTMTVINEDHYAGVYNSRAQPWYWEGRLYFLEEGGAAPTMLVSILPDGTDYRVDHDVDLVPGATNFALGNGPEYI